jgi:hypothetical protein
MKNGLSQLVGQAVWRTDVKRIAVLRLWMRAVAARSEVGLVAVALFRAAGIEVEVGVHGSVEIRVVVGQI